MKEALNSYIEESDEGFLVELEKFGDDGNGVKSFAITMDSYNTLGGVNYEASGKFFMKCLNDWGLFYYARPAESFSMLEAYKEAHMKGCRGVVLENMS